MIRKNNIKSIIIIALPLMAAFLAQRGMQFIDTVMMGWIGSTALAAGALGTALFGTTVIFCMGVLSAIGVFIARAKGSENISDIQPIMQHGVVLALILSVPCMLFIWLVPQILLRIGEDAVVVENVSLLLHGMVWGLPGFLLFAVFKEFIAAFSLTLIVMLVSFVSMPLTFAANYVLIYGQYHFPQLGIAGIGFAGAIIMWFMFFCLLGYSKKHPLLKEHLVMRSFKFDYDQFNDMLRIGMPSGMLLLLDAGMFLAAVILMGYLGVTALAAHQIALQCANVAYTVPVALSIAAAMQVGHAAGAKNFAQVKQSAFHSLGLALFASAVIAVIFIFAAHFIVGIFINKHVENFAEVSRLATSLLSIAALFLCFDATAIVANGILRGLRDTFVPMLLSTGCYWLVGVGSAYCLSTYTPLGPKGIWYGLTLGLFSTAVILVLRFVQKLARQAKA
jgi:MATE family multidrug resistance protein